jgi:hypothetical protein
MSNGTVEVSAEMACVAAQELEAAVERTGGCDVGSNEASTPLAAVRQRLTAAVDEGYLSPEAYGIVQEVLAAVADERGVEFTDADPLTDEVLAARREFERVLGSES